MKRSLLLCAGLAAGALCGHLAAAPVTPEEALGRLESSKARAYAPGRNNMKLSSTVGNLYIFSSGQGYAVLPNDDLAPALLGYSESGRYKKGENPNLDYWLEFLSGEIEYLAENSDAQAPAQTRPEREAIDPMLSTKWNQGEPYNNLCPVFGGHRSVTGCVATAMAQVMKYHNYPTQGIGTFSYTCTYNGESKNLSFDYANTTFEWDLMTDTYGDESTEASKNAVATLMYACGVSVEMGYTPNESGAITNKLGPALIRNFGYDKGLWVPHRDAYGILEWEDMIYADLAQGLPVLYGGQGSGGGHQFVCDGYSRDGYFHFNWGWGGMSDGYFLLTALNPGSLGTGGGAGGYNTKQEVVLGMRPAQADSEPTYVMYATKDLKADRTSVALGNVVYITCGIFNYSTQAIPSGNVGFKIQSEDGTYTKYAGYSIEDLGIYSGYNQIGFTFPKVEDGTYIITPAYRIGEGEWRDARTFLGCNNKVIATVANGTATFSYPAPASITVTDIQHGTIYKHTGSPLTFTITNPGTEEYLGKIYPYLLNADGTAVSITTEYIPVDITPGSSITITDFNAIFATINGQTFEAGTYTLVFRDEQGNNISVPMQVEVKAQPTSVSIGLADFKLVSPDPVGDKSAVKFSASVYCGEGYYAGSLRLYIFPYIAGNVSSVASFETPMFYVEAGQTDTKEFEVDLSSLDNGKYFCQLRHNQLGWLEPQVVFTLDQTSTALDEIDAAETGEETIYDLKGMRHTRPLAPGLYIINGVKTLVK